MKSKAAKSEIVIPANLSEDAIMEQILPRLPVKSLTRFKSVSKYWLSTISSQKFVKTHLQFSSSRLQSLLLYGHYIHEGSCFISFDEFENVKEIVELGYDLSSSYPRNHPPGEGGLESYVIGSSNGLVCLYELIFCFYIWNPAMKLCHNVSSPDFDHELPNEVTSMGFGYVSSIDDYRIGLLIQDEDLCYSYVYSLRSQKWITMPSLDESNENYDFRVGPRDYVYQGVVVDDTLYWPPLISCHKKDAHIVGLNLVNGEMKKFPLTIELIDGYHDGVRVFQLKGCLSLCFYNKCVEDDNNSTSFDIDVWKLKHQNDWNSWEKLISFDFGGRDLLWLFENGKYLLKVNSNQTMPDNDDNDFSHVALEQYEGITIWPGSNKRFYMENSIYGAWGYVESLVSPFGTTLSDENEDH